MRNFSEEDIKRIISQQGFYDRHGCWNSIIERDGELFRGRVETLILKEDKIFLQFTNNHKTHYRIPGGSYNKNILNINQAKNECKEEARIIIKDIYFTNESYVEYKNKNHIKSKLKWNGDINEIYIANYDSDYNGIVYNKDIDNDMYNKGKFYYISDVIDNLKPEHQKVLIKHLKDSEYSYLVNKYYNMYYPYYTPNELISLGVYNLTNKNKYYDNIIDDSIDWFYEYINTGKNTDSDNWVKEVQYRYELYKSDKSNKNKQLLLDLGWNYEIIPTLYNIIEVSKNTEKRFNKF